MAAEDISVEPRTASGKWMPWVRKGALAIADQGIFALSNFLLNVLLVRWLSPADYGAFALAYSVFLSLLLVHSALLTTPMLVFGQGKYRDRFADYLGVLLRGHLALILPGSALLVMVAFVLGHLYSPVVEHAFIALAIGAPFILLLWLLRRAFYARLDPVWAATSGLVNLAVSITCAVTLHHVGHLTPATGFLSMAAGSAITSVILLARLRPGFSASPGMFRTVMADHWNYGKWVAAGAGPNWVTDNIYYLVLSAWLGLAQVGALRALLNLAQPAMQSVSALGVLLMPILVRDRTSHGPMAMARTIRLFTALLIGGCTVYMGVLFVFRLQIFHSLYGGKFAGYGGWPLIAVGLIPIAQSLPNVVGAALGAIEKPKLGFWADTWSAGFAVVVGVGLAYWLGVGGALLGISLSYVLMGFLTLLFYNRAIRSGDSSAQPPAAVPGPPNIAEVA